MTVDEYDKQIYMVFSRVFAVPPEQLSADTRRGDLEGWDSLGHILLIEALCEEFGLAIAPERALGLETIHDVKTLIVELKTR